ncbi:MAG: hypothetical protein ABFD94_02585 [Armatimonadia bacterium]
MAKWTLLAIMLMTCGCCFAQEEVKGGEWSLEIGKAYPGALRYGGEVLFKASSLSSFVPDYSRTRFTIGEAKVEVAERKAIWKKAMEGQEATITAEVAPEKVRLGLDTTITAAGPTEWAVDIVPEAVRATEGHVSAQVNGRTKVLDLVAGFDALNGVRELRFEQPARSVVVRCSSASLQDRRARGQGLFLVMSIGSDGTKAVTEQRFIEIEVIPAKPEEIAARKAFLAQSEVVRRDVPVPNGGFEEGLKIWSDNPRATVDKEIKHDGAQSARVTIPVDQTDRTGIYLTQQVPIIEGLSYQLEGWVKTQGVKAAVLGGMSATGADLIIEFADKQGNWMASGDYAGGTFGDKDWRRVVGKSVQAPIGAGYAVIFLSMRATGTAWFDDIKLTESKHHVVLQSPGNEQKVADNSPTFAWQFTFHNPATLELSQDPAFPAQGTVKVEKLEGSPYSLNRTIAPGKWYWRVSVPERQAVSPVWNFEQTAPLTQDCTEPTIERDHAYLKSARQKATVRFADNVGVKDVTVLLDGQNVTKQAAIGKDKLEIVPAGGWKVGLNKLNVTVKDAAGNAATRQIYITRALNLPLKEWLPNGGMRIDGKLKFPLGMYGVRTQDLPEMAAAGYDFVHNYTWDGNGTNETAIEYMDACQKLGLQAFIGFDRSRLQAMDEEFVAERVGALMGHPGLLAWYLFDEPDLPHQYVSPDQLRALYRLIKTLDPSHPVIVTVAQTNLMPLYNGSYDVYWSMDYQTPKANVKNFEGHRAALAPGVPIMSIVHSYDGNQSKTKRGGAPPDLVNYQPDAKMMRACAFMAIAHNSSGLAWWWWGQGSDAFVTVADVPAAWAGLKATLKQIKLLEPVLTAQVTPRMWVEKTGEDREVHLWEKTVGGRTVIIAVNRDPEACEVTIASPELAKAKTVREMFESRDVATKDGKIIEKLEGLGVRVYEVK